jgi:phosphatidylglycerophosphatase A
MKERLVDFLGSGFGSGFIPLMPGTMGSLLAVGILSIGVFSLPEVEFILFTTIFLLISLLLHAFTVSVFCDKHGKDAGSFVLDEWVGQTIPFFALLPFSELHAHFPLLILLAFGLFRLFDILKPLGINKLQDLPGGWGVLTDDVLAGLYALFCLKMIIFYVF